MLKFNFNHRTYKTVYYSILFLYINVLFLRHFFKQIMWCFLQPFWKSQPMRKILCLMFCCCVCIKPNAALYVYTRWCLYWCKIRKNMFLLFLVIYAELTMTPRKTPLLLVDDRTMITCIGCTCPVCTAVAAVMAVRPAFLQQRTQSAMHRSQSTCEWCTCTHKHTIYFTYTYPRP